MNTKEWQYNQSLTVADLTREEAFNTKEWDLLTYSKPHDECQGIEINLGNQGGGYPFKVLDTDWRAVEYLYMCGRWSNNTDEHLEIQKDIMTAPSGYAVKRYKKPKHQTKMRTDFDTFKIQWMLWCLWQKCLGSETFHKHLLSMPNDKVIVEYVKNDKVWAAYDDGNGVIRGCNAVPKILTICKRCLEDGTAPDIDTELLNSAEIYIMGKRVEIKCRV